MKKIILSILFASSVLYGSNKVEELERAILNSNIEKAEELLPVVRLSAELTHKPNVN